METLNIIQLIEKNSITRLSKDYENRFLTKIKENFNENQQQLFVASFYCFLNYDSKKDFIIDFDNVWKWLGFTRKDNSKRLLEKFFIIDIDYKTQKDAPPKGGAAFSSKNLGGAGLNKETITLTINTFKKFCLKAGTKKADEVHDYYIKLEDLLQETLNEESNELRKQLEYKNIENIELYNQNKNLTKNVIRRFSNKYKEGSCLYLISSSEISDKFKVGMTSNINNRLSDLSTGSPYYFEIIELYYTSFNALLEKTIKEMFAKYRISVNCEWYELKIIDKMKEFIKIYIESYKNFEDNSNANIVNDTKESRLSISDNKKTCLECNKVFDLKQFFFSDKKNKIFLNNCILCYEKKHGDSKQCSKCEIIKNKLDYVVDRTKKDGLTYDCKECRYEQTKKRKEEIKKENPNIGKKQCITCKNFEMVKLFYKIKINEKTQYTPQCKKCYCEEHGQSKQCFTCKEIKICTEFDKKTANADGLECYCKICRKIQRDIERSDKKSKEDPNKDKKQCLKCTKWINNNEYFKKFDKISYYDECMKCYDSNCLQCNKCNEIKEVTYFSKDVTKKNGYRTICKICTKNKI